MKDEYANTCQAINIRKKAAYNLTAIQTWFIKTRIMDVATDTNIRIAILLGTSNNDIPKSPQQIRSQNKFSSPPHH